MKRKITDNDFESEDSEETKKAKEALKIKKSSLGFLKRLLDGHPTDSNTTRFPEEGLESWHKFYIEYLSDYQINRAHEYLRKKVLKLKACQVPCFVFLIWLTWMEIDKMNNDNGNLFFGRKVTDLSLFIFAFKCCMHISNIVISITEDCWFCDLVDNYKYPQIKFSEMELKKKGNQGLRAFQKENGVSEIQVHLHRWSCYLFNDFDITGSLQAGHRCSNTKCFSPFHMKPITDAKNKDDKGCKYGCANYCPHEPVCIWTSKKTGSILPCRNDKDNVINCQNCTHQPNCFEHKTKKNNKT
jgi:hypothetical protein